MTEITVTISCDESDKERLVQILYSIPDLIGCEFGIDCDVEEVI